MNWKIIFKSLLIWMGMIPIAFVNGGLREVILIPAIGRPAVAISGILLITMIYFWTVLFIKKLGNNSHKTYLMMGIIWMIMTVIFEFALGIIFGQSMQTILENYNLMNGNLWTLVIIAIAFIPLAAAKYQNCIK